MAIFTFEQAIKKEGVSPSSVKSMSQPTALAALDSGGGFVSGVGASLQKRGENLSETLSSEQNPALKGLNIVGQGAGFVGDVATEAIGSIPGVKDTLQGIAETSIGKLGIKALRAGGDMWESFKEVHPEQAQVIGDVGNILGLIPIGLGGKVAGGVAVKTAEKVADTARSTAEAVKPVVQRAGDIASMVGGGISRIPSKIATNVAEKQAGEAAIKQLPTNVAQTAARDGIDVVDIKSLYQIPKTIKTQARDLFDTVAKFAKKETDIDPIEIVGRPIVQKLQQLEKAKGTIGQRLGEVSNNLGNVVSKDVITPVFAELKKVPGLSGLEISPEGIINFKNTVLTTAETAADRKAVQQIFTDAVKDGTGKQKHLLRQELFEVIGGKKKALVQLTGTQEKAYEAIRKGLSDVLEAKNSQYKALSNEYRKIIQPITEMRKALQAIPGTVEDVLDMNAGLLARRLTSTSLSQGKIRSILEALDNATAVKGNLRETTEQLQKLYNTLGKYYDIAPSTGFQGQVKAGVEGASGLVDTVTGAIRGVAGETQAVRQKALESILKEILAD